jgi:hypothetical protein
MSRSIETTGSMLREIQNSTNRMKKIRRMLTELRSGQARESDWIKISDMAIEAVVDSARITSALTLALSDPDILLKLVQMQRFATGLLVKARRVKLALSKPGGISELSTSAGFDMDDDLAGEE